MDRRLPGDEDRLAPDRDVVARLIGLAVACAVPFTVLAVWARATTVADWELALVAALALAAGPYGDLIRGLNALGELPIWSLIVAVIAAALVAVRQIWAALLVGLTLAGDLVGFLVKLAVERARPEGVILQHLLGGESFAFPSGHVVRATALVAAIAWLVAPAPYRLPVAVAGGLIAGALMGYARVALGVHWPTDAAGGLLLGLAWFGLTAAAIQARRQARPDRPA